MRREREFVVSLVGVGGWLRHGACAGEMGQ